MEKRIFELRKSLGLTLEDFGNRIGITATTVSLYEKGKRVPRATTIAVICNEFHVNRKWLVDGEGDMYTNPVEDETAIDNIMKIFECTKEEAQYLQLFFQMDEKDRKNIYKLMKDTLDYLEKMVLQ